MEVTPTSGVGLHVRWAKDFDTFLQGRPLKNRSRNDIEAFLADLGKRPGIADWQVRQAEHALKILYEIFLPAYAPEKHTPLAPLLENILPKRA